MVVFETTLLLPFLRPEVAFLPVPQARDRLDFLVKQLDKAKTRIGVPTPVLSEVMVKDEKAGLNLIRIAEQSLVFKMLPFDEVAAIELAAMTRKALTSTEKKGGVKESWQKIKIDRQIVAIAKVSRATAIYSDDHGVRSFAKEAGITTIGLGDLPLPPVGEQGAFTFDLPREKAGSDEHHAQASENDSESEASGSDQENGAGP